MPLLHDPAVHTSIRARLERLTPNATRQWGKMSVDQMLWHCNEVLENSLGKPPSVSPRPPLPHPILKFFLFNLPWPHGAPTHPDFVAGERHSFDDERRRALALVDRFTSRPIGATEWGVSGALGKMTGREWSRLQAKHLDHHLRQFNA